MIGRWLSTSIFLCRVSLPDAFTNRILDGHGGDMLGYTFDENYPRIYILGKPNESTAPS